MLQYVPFVGTLKVLALVIVLQQSTKMNKEEYIKKWGGAAYEKQLQWARDWKAGNPDEVIACSQQQCRKGGKYYEKHLEQQHTGIPGERRKIRCKHGDKYRSFKQIIAPESQIHHEWIPGTAEYTGVALVEKDQHMHGFVDVIKILEGKITLLTEKEIRGI